MAAVGTEKPASISPTGDAGDSAASAASKKNRAPAMQIYRPPGLRSGPDTTSATTKPNEAAGQKQPQAHQRRASNNSSEGEKNNNVSPTSDGCRVVETPVREEQQQNARINGGSRELTATPPAPQGGLTRTHSSLSSESNVSQKSKSSVSSGMASLGSMGRGPAANGAVHGVNHYSSPSMGYGNGNVGSGRPTTQTKAPSPPAKTLGGKVKQMTPRDIQELIGALRQLAIPNQLANVEQLIASEFTSDEAGECVGQALTQHAIEGAGGGVGSTSSQGGGSNVTRAATRVAAALAGTKAASAVQRGALTALLQYWDCRERLRAEHFRVWLAFLAFSSDLYANVGDSPDGDLVGVVFQIFDYLLKAPVLETLKIEELESLISALLAVGYDLERECPEQLAHLKDLIRDALVEVSEPWARKMILLLLELGASGWKLPPEANEYYFQQTSN